MLVKLTPEDIQALLEREFSVKKVRDEILERMQKIAKGELNYYGGSKHKFHNAMQDLTTRMTGKDLEVFVHMLDYHGKLNEVVFFAVECLEALFDLPPAPENKDGAS